MKAKIAIIVLAVIVATASLAAVSVAGGIGSGPQTQSYVDDTNTADGQAHWVVRITFPNGFTTFAVDPLAIAVTSPSDVASWFPGTDQSEWHSIAEGSFTVWVFHSGQTKNLTVPFGTLQFSATNFLTTGQSASTQDATWRFGNRSTTQSSAGQTQSSTRGTLASCPTSATDAANMGGNSSSWSLIPGTQGSGWHFEEASALLTAPSFGRLDTPSGGLRNGQSTTTGVATFWCQG